MDVRDLLIPEPSREYLSVKDFDRHTNQPIRAIYEYCLDAAEARNFQDISHLMHDMTPYLRDKMTLTGDPPTPIWYLDIAVLLTPSASRSRVPTS